MTRPVRGVRAARGHSAMSLPRYMFIPQVNSYTPGSRGTTSIATVWFYGRCARRPNSGSTTSSPHGVDSRRVKFSRKGRPAFTTMDAGW